MARPPDGIYHAELATLLPELRSLTGQHLQVVRQPTRDAIYLTFGGGEQWVISLRPVARLHRASRRPKNPAKPYSFQSLLRARLTAPLSRVTLHPTDRILDLHFGSMSLHVRLYPGGGLWLMQDGAAVAGLDGPAPSVLPTPEGRGGDEAEPRFSAIDGTAAGLEAEAWFEQALRLFRTTSSREDASRQLKAQQKKDRRLLKALLGDLAASEQAQNMRRAADSMGAVLHTLRPGPFDAQVADWEDPGVVHEVHIRPGETAPQAMQRLYDKAKRLERAQDHVLDRIDAAETRVAERTDDLARLPACDAAELRTLRKRWKLKPPVLQAAAHKPPKRPAPTWEIWHGPSAGTVPAVMWVGRSGPENRRMVFGAARGYDVWVHLKDLPSAHVILRASKQRPPPLEHLLAAATVLLRKARADDNTPYAVQYTPVRHLRAVPGDTTGKVIVHHERVLTVRKDPEHMIGWEKVERP